MFDKLRAEFENNNLPEAVAMPDMTFTQAIAGKDEEEFTELPKDDEPDESTSLAVRLAMNQKEYEQEKDDKLDKIMADIREFELSQQQMEEEKHEQTNSQALVDQILKAQEKRTEKEWEAGGGAPSKEAVLAEIEARIDVMLNDEEEGELSNIDVKQ